MNALLTNDITSKKRTWICQHDRPWYLLPSVNQSQQWETHHLHALPWIPLIHFPINHGYPKDIYIWLNYRLIWNSRNVRLFGDDSPFTILIIPVTSQCEVMIKFEAVIISLHYPFYNPYCRWLHPMIFQFITVKITINHHKINMFLPFIILKSPLITSIIS